MTPSSETLPVEAVDREAVNTPSEAVAVERAILPTSEEMHRAAAIVGSSQVVGQYAACEWDCLHKDGQIWIAAIVREATAAERSRAEAAVRNGLRKPVAKEQAYAVFTITVGENGRTGLHSQAAKGAIPYIALDKAIAALLAERVEARTCPRHVSDEGKSSACPFCGCEQTYADRNFQGHIWTTCSNRNCGANAPEAMWAQLRLAASPDREEVERAVEDLIAWGVCAKWRSVDDQREWSKRARKARAALSARPAEEGK